jgi:tetratricopeptide (TPR) repeat protein
VFISYATKDRRRALSICEDIEKRGISCWISCRDVQPGENYQEAIVRALRESRVVVLAFSGAANDSDEIKKELSLASRYRIPVIALRLEEVEPSDAFAYELSTRQWIDAFENKSRSIDLLVSRVGQIAEEEAPATARGLRVPVRRSASRRSLAIAAGGILILLLTASAWWWLRPAPAVAHSMTVRLAGVQLLSSDLPKTMPDAVSTEVIAAFNEDGAVGVSTASAPASGTDPAYALGGTIRRDGDKIRVITRLTNERSGATLWSDNFDYDGNEVSKIPRHIAVDAGNVVRCGLFGASTYRKPLPDAVLRDYMQFCQAHWDPNLAEGRKALVPAQRVVAALPDFSWGWAAVAGAYWKVAMTAETERLAEEARASGRQAADRAVSLDRKNSEALYIKSMLVDRHDWISREDLLKRAVAARRLDCGCEHHQYGWMLLNVGRVNEAIDQLRQADDMLALYVYTPLTLADGLVAAGKPAEAREYFDAAISLAPSSGFAADLAAYEAADLGDIKALLDPKLPIPAERRAALVRGYRAIASADTEAKAQALRSLLALPADQQDAAVARLLADLGASHDAFLLASRIATEHEYPGPSLFFYRNMRATLADPSFPAVAAKLGLMNYWKRSRTRPDVCSERAAPPFCRMI